MWSRLGKNLVDSGLAGGVNDDYEFYVVLENGTPVFFAPFSFDGSPGVLSVQFGMPIKRFASAPHGLEQWAGSQPARQSVEATLVPTGSGMEQVLWAMASFQPHQVTDQSLYALCSAKEVRRNSRHDKLSGWKLPSMYMGRPIERAIYLRTDVLPISLRAMRASEPVEA